MHASVVYAWRISDAHEPPPDSVTAAAPAGALSAQPPALQQPDDRCSCPTSADATHRGGAVPERMTTEDIATAAAEACEVEENDR